MALCPICKSVAVMIAPGTFGGTTFFCANHNEFAVTDNVLRTASLMNASAARWELAWLEARSRAAKPQITAYDF